MAKIQSRRTVSMNRRVFAAASAHAASLGISFSRLTEDLLLTAIGDASLTTAIGDHRAAEAARTAASPKVEARGPSSLGTRRGNPGTCSSCGDRGHYAAKDGLCSPTYVAALMVLDDGWSVTAAAKECGVSARGVWTRLRTERRRAA